MATWSMDNPDMVFFVTHLQMISTYMSTFVMVSSHHVGLFSIDKSESYSRWKILMLPGFLGVCLCYMMLSVVQHGVLQWAQLYLVDDHKHSLLIGIVSQIPCD